MLRPAGEHPLTRTKLHTPQPGIHLFHIHPPRQGSGPPAHIRRPQELGYLPLRTRLKDGTMVEVDVFRERCVLRLSAFNQGAGVIHSFHHHTRVPTEHHDTQTHIPQNMQRARSRVGAPEPRAGRRAVVALRKHHDNARISGVLPDSCRVRRAQHRSQRSRKRACWGAGRILHQAQLPRPLRPHLQWGLHYARGGACVRFPLLSYTHTLHVQ